MKREEILEKSRMDNKGEDLYEQEVLKESRTPMIAVIYAFALIFMMLGMFVGGRKEYEMAALMMVVAGVECTVKAVRQRDKQAAVRAVLAWIVFIYWTVMYVRELIAAAAIL